METLKRFQLSIFQRMTTLQHFCMQSEIAFILFQILKLLLHDTFIITIFISPLPTLTATISNYFKLINIMNVPISIGMALALVGMVAATLSKSEYIQNKFRTVLQVVIPWVDVCALLFITINIQLLQVNASQKLWLVPFNVLSIISTSLITLFYTLFNFTKEPRSNNLLKRREAKAVTFSDITNLLLCYYLAAAYTPSQIPKNIAIIFSLIQFALSLVKIKQRVFLQFYLDSFSQYVSSLFYFVELNLSLLVLTIYLMQQDLLSQNIYFILLLMTLLEYSALNAFLAKRNGNMFLSSAEQLKDEEQAMLYLQRLYELISKVEMEEQDIILVSLKKKHSVTCKIPECPCQRPQFDIGYFIREYVRCELQVMTEMFHSSLSVLFSILYFKIIVFKYYPQILAKLNYYSSHLSLSLTQRYYKYSLTQYVKEFIRKRNQEIDAVDSQHMFKLEEIRAEIEVLIKGEIEVRSKLWKYLSRGLCRISQLQHTCNQSLRNITRLMCIFADNKLKFKKSKEFNLLLLFYFLKVSFINNGKEIKQNLKELYYGYKEDELYSLKEFKKFIYHKRSCVIQTLIDTKTMGIITAASRNVEDMFGFPTSKVIGISINNLMPQFMAEEHEVVMADWAQSGTWRTIGKLKQIYCIHKEQFCFSALIYLKIYIKDNSMHFITNIFKLNDSDFLVINPHLKVEGLGKKFLKLLGEPAKRINLELLIEHGSGLLSQEAFPEGKTYRKVFLSLKNMQTEVDTYLENINMKFDQDEKRQINRKFHERLINVCAERYLIEFSIKRYKMGKISFLVINLKESKRVEQHQTGTYLQRPQRPVNGADNSRDNSKDLIEFQVAESQEDSFMKEEDNDQLIIEHNASSSLASLSQKQNYPIAKTIEKFITLVQNPSKIKDARLSTFNLVMVVILVLLSVIDFISFYCYRQMLLQIQGIFFADGAQSDIMQTTQIGYSYIYMLKSQLLSDSPTTEFESTLQSARLINNYVYSLRESHFASLITSVAELSKNRLYSYLEQPATWTLHRKTTEVITHQFLQNMYYLSSRVINQLEELKLTNSTKINSTFFYELFKNFPQMQRLNQYYLNDYQSISNDQHNMLNFFTISSLLIYFILSFILSLSLNHYFKFRFNQLIISFSFFSFVSNQYLQKMKDYYSQLITSVVESDKLKAIDLHEDDVFQIDTYDLFHKNDITKNGITSKIKFINYQNYYKWIFILLAFCLFNAINYLATSQIRNFFPDSQNVITQVNELMRSENTLLESYFNLRAAYSLNAGKFINQTLYNQLIVHLNNTDTKFNSVANQLTTVFSNYDPNYENNFVNTLVTSVCQLSAPYLTPFENTKCLKELKLQILDGGILISMNFFQRNVRTALEDLRQVYIIGNSTPYKGDYFLQLDFVQLDKMLIYMFKIYQQTQSIAFNSYIITIQIITSSYLKLTVGMTAFFIFVMLVWLKSVSAQKQNLSCLYGHLLLIPFMILKSNTRIATNLKEAVQYSDI